MHLAGKRGNLIAIVDVGSGSVGLTYAMVRRGMPASVMAAERVVLSPEERSKEATITKLAEGLDEAAKKIRQTKIPTANEVYCIVHAPWTRSRSVSASSHFEKEKVITDSIIGALAQQALGSETELDRSNILEASVVRIELNGYPAGEPVGKSARDIALYALLSDCDADVRAGMQPSLQRTFAHLTPIFRSSTRALLTVLRERPRDGDDYLIVDVGSEATNLVVVRGGVVSAQRLVSEGMRSMLARIAPTGMQEETLNLVRMLESDECSSGACQTIQESMARAEPEMVRVFGEGMAASATSKKLPNRLLLLAHPDMSVWLSRFFARIDFTQFTQTTQPFVIQTLSAKELENFVIAEKGVVLDTGLAISAALVNIEKSRA